MPSKKLEKLLRDRQRNNTAAEEKVAVYIKLSPSVVSYFKSQGRGYQTRINNLLTEYVSLARLEASEASADENRSMENYLNNDERTMVAQQLFKKFYAQCFWHLQPDLKITRELLPIIARGLRLYGGREGFIEAKRLCP